MKVSPMINTRISNIQQGISNVQGRGTTPPFGHPSTGGEFLCAAKFPSCGGVASQRDDGVVFPKRLSLGHWTFLVGCWIFASLALPHAALARTGRDAQPSTRLELGTTPPGAEVHINHQKRGTTPLSITDLPAGTHLLQLTRPGHRSILDTFTLEEGIPRPLTFALEPLTGLLLVTTNPGGAEVTCNGAALGQTPLLITTLEPGTHRLSLALPGYQRKEIDVILKDRTPVKQEVELMSASGTLNVTSDPADADVLVNGIARGKTPCRIDRIPDGSVNIEVKAPGFESHTRQVALAAGEVQNIDVALKPLPGTLRIVSIPSGARVYVNDEYKDVTPYDFVNAPPGTYRVRVEQTGFSPNARNIELAKGESITEEFRLTKVMGRLEVTTAPAGASIFLDGKRIGVTAAKGTDTTAVSQPFPIEDVLEGEHQVEVTRPGYATQRRDITVHRDMTLTLQIQLVRQFIPNYEVVTTRATYKGVLEFKNDEGISLETRPGISQLIPMKDVKQHGPLRKEE